MDRVEHVFILIEIEDWFCLLVVFHEAMADRVDVIVGATACLATFEHTFYEYVFRHFKAEDAAEVEIVFFEEIVEYLGLFHSARETVEEESVGVGVVDDEFLYYLSYYLIGGEATVVDDVFHLQSYLRACCYLSAKHLSCRDVS